MTVKQSVVMKLPVTLQLLEQLETKCWFLLEALCHPLVVCSAKSHFFIRQRAVVSTVAVAYVYEATGKVILKK